MKNAVQLVVSSGMFRGDVKLFYLPSWVISSFGVEGGPGVWGLVQNDVERTKTFLSTENELSDLISRAFCLEWDTIDLSDVLHEAIVLGVLIYMKSPGGEDLVSDVDTWDSITGQTIDGGTWQSKVSDFNNDPAICLGCKDQISDIVFLLDRSDSIENDEWDSVLNFVNETVDRLDVSPDGVHIAIITFSTEAIVWTAGFLDKVDTGHVYTQSFDTVKSR